MLRNSKILICDLNDEQVKVLNELGFYNESWGRNEYIKKESQSIEKYYNCCGGTFTLMVHLYEKKVKIHTPYNNWWCSNWEILEFTKDMEKFQEELKSDIKQLRKVGIIS